MMDEQQKKYQAMLDALNDEDRLKLRNALEDLDSSLLETSMEDLEGFVKEKYPNAKIVQGNVVQDGEVIGKTTELYKNDAYDNFIQELYDERFQKSIGIEPDTNIIPEGELTDKTFVDDGKTYSIEKPKGSKLLSALKWLDPVEEAITSGLAKVGLTGTAATYAIAEASNFIGNLIFEGLRSEADVQMINSKILTGKATDEEIKELNDKIIKNFKTGMSRATKVSPAANVSNWIGKMLDR